MYSIHCIPCPTTFGCKILFAKILVFVCTLDIFIYLYNKNVKKYRLKLIDVAWCKLLGFLVFLTLYWFTGTLPVLIYKQIWQNSPPFPTKFGVITCIIWSPYLKERWAILCSSRCSWKDARVSGSIGKLCSSLL